MLRLDRPKQAKKQTGRQAGRQKPALKFIMTLIMFG
jgi:hypothetical protein